MKKTLLSTLVLSSLSFFSLSSQAEDLYTVYRLAVQKDPLVLQAAASRDAAVARIDSSRASLLPNVTLSAAARRTDNDGFNFDGTNAYSGTLSLSQTLFDWSSWKSLSRAEKSALQSQTSYDSVLQVLITRVADAYFGVLKAIDDVGFAEAEKRSIERQLEQTKQRFAVGLTAITDVHEAQAQFDSAIAAAISAENTLENARELLREITGQYHAELNQLNTSRFSTGTPSPANVQEWLLLAEDNNLALQAQRIALEIATQDIDLAQAGHYPTLGLSAQLGANKTQGIDRSDSSSIGVNLNVPIYSGGGTVAAVEVAKANFVNVSEVLEQNHRSVIRQVRSSFNNVNALISSIRALEQAVISSESALKATEAGFEVGTRTIVDVLLSNSNLFNARRNLSSARYDYLLALLALKQAAGNLNEQDLIAINQILDN